MSKKHHYHMGPFTKRSAPDQHKQVSLVFNSSSKSSRSSSMLITSLSLLLVTLISSFLISPKTSDPHSRLRLFDAVQASSIPHQAPWSLRHDNANGHQHDATIITGQHEPDQQTNNKQQEKSQDLDQLNNQQNNNNFIDEQQVRSTSEQANALEYLQKYGYMSAQQSNGAASNLIHEDSFTEAVKNFQRFASINETGLIDSETLKLMQTPRCGNTDLRPPDTFPNSHHTTRATNSPSPPIRLNRLLSGDSHQFNSNHHHVLIASHTQEPQAADHQQWSSNHKNNRENRSRRQKRYALQGSKWRRQELTYRISQYPTRFAAKRSDVDAQIERAFGIWSHVAPIDFVVKREGKVHIDIRFASGEHGDGDAFDGPGNTLAHAYFPQYGGDAHFDDQEYWTIDSYAGTNIFQVAAHELGHSLGLGHSNVREALMAPFYQKYKPNFKLHLDDILAIQALYGEKKPQSSEHQPPPSTTMTTTSSSTTPTPGSYLPGAGSGSPTSTPRDRPPTTFFNARGGPGREPSSENPEGGSFPDLNGNGIAGSGVDDPLAFQGAAGPASRQPNYGGSNSGPPDLCVDSQIDASTRTEDGTSFVFKGNYYWQLTRDGVAKGYPRKISNDWDGLTGYLDGALTWADGKTFFFKGNKYWRFRNKRRDIGYPKLISAGFAGIPDDIDAAFVWSGNGRTYFFKGSQYWRYDSKADPPVSSEYPRSIKIWRGLPNYVNAALKWENNITYFFKGNQYYRFNDREFRVEARGRPPFPRPTGEWWFGCIGSNLAAQRAMPTSVDQAYQAINPIRNNHNQNQNYQLNLPSPSMKTLNRLPISSLDSSHEWALLPASAGAHLAPSLGTHVSDASPTFVSNQNPEPGAWTDGLSSGEAVSDDWPEIATSPSISSPTRDNDQSIRPAPLDQSSLHQQTTSFNSFIIPSFSLNPGSLSFSSSSAISSHSSLEHMTTLVSSLMALMILALVNNLMSIPSSNDNKSKIIDVSLRKTR